MIVRLGFLVAASAAVYTVKQISIKSLQPPPSTTKYSVNIENGEVSSKQDQNEKGEEEHFIDFTSTTAKDHGDKITRIRNARSSDSTNPSAFNDEKEPILLEMVKLQNQVKELEGRKVKLERKLLKSYKLKEQESELDELQRHFKIRIAEIEMLNISINSLQEERKKLQEEIKKGVSAMKELEMEKRKIRRLLGKTENGSNQMKGQVLMLKQQVTSLQSETVTQRDAMADKNVKILDILELEILEVKRKNKELQLEKRELTLKLIAAKSKIIAFSNLTESKVASEMEEEVNSLKIAKEDLSKQVERIQKSRFSVVEELVYQRWVSACLRYEIQHHHKCFSMNLGSKTQEKVKKKQAKYVKLDSGKGDVGLNSISSTVSLSTSSFEGSSSSRTSLSRRSSISMVPAEALMLTNADDSGIASIVKEKDSTESVETPKLQRTRRVSFNNSVDNEEASLGKMSKSVQGELNLSSGSQAEVEGAEQIRGSGDSIEQPKNHKSDTQENHFVDIFYSLLLMLLVYLLLQVVDVS